MRKLRLIKPWRLRTVRQRTDGEERYRTTQDMMVPCNGPRGASEEVTNTRAAFIDLRSFNNVVLRIFYPATQAPESDPALLKGRNAYK